MNELKFCENCETFQPIIEFHVDYFSKKYNIFCRDCENL